MEDVISGWIFPLLTTLGIAGIVVLMRLDRLPMTWRRWAAARALVKLAVDTRRLFLAPRSAMAIFTVSLLGHINLSIVAFVLALALSINASLADCLVLIPPVILVTTLPISIAGWGVREGTMVAAFGMIGVPNEGSFALSLLFGFMSLCASLPGGILWALGRERLTSSSNGAVPP